MNIYILKSSFGYIVSLRDRDFVRAEEICTKQSILSEISRISLELAKSHNARTIQYEPFGCSIPVFVCMEDATSFKQDVDSKLLLLELRK